ncbi:MAG TPA: universal stress protein [Solirubrobacteraceae bacterium]
MFSTIVVGVDGHEGGRAALALAQCVGDAAGGSIVAVHVQPYEPIPMRGPRPDLEASTREESHELLGMQLAVSGVAARVHVAADSSPARGLHAVAEGLDADLIVVGSPHRGPVGRILAEDTVRGVLHGASCPVLVARHDDLDASLGRRVVGVGYDGSRQSRAGLRWAQRLAEVIDGSVRLLCAAEPAQAFSPAISYGINWVALAPERREHAERLVAEAVAELGARATGEAVVGMADDELLRFSKDVDLLVLGSRGYGAVRRTLLGSTSDRLVDAAACPVVVIPRGGHDERATDGSEGTGKAKDEPDRVRADEVAAR